MVYDYIIVGGGPAGSVVARELQLTGAECLVIEKRKTIGEKTCGGLLTWSGLRLLKISGIDIRELEQLGAVRIKGFHMMSEENTEIHNYHCNEYAIGLSRKIFDSWLLDKAIESGVDVLMGINVRDITYKGTRICAEGYEAKNIIFATGARGFCKYANQNILRGQTFGLSAQITGNTILKNENVYFWYIDDSRDYFWAIPNGKELWNIGVWFEKMRPNPIDVFEYCKMKYLDKYFARYEFVKPLKGAFCGNVDLSGRLPERCYGVGDFAGNNIGNSGEGLRYAIESAVIFRKNRDKKVDKSLKEDFEYVEFA